MQNWIELSNIKKVKGFLGLVIYFRIWIKDFRLIAEPLYLLTRKGIKFHWDPNIQRKAKKQLQNILCFAPVLCKIDYNKDVKEIVISMDSNDDG